MLSVTNRVPMLACLAAADQAALLQLVDAVVKLRPNRKKQPDAGLVRAGLRRAIAVWQHGWVVDTLEYNSEVRRLHPLPVSADAEWRADVRAATASPHPACGLVDPMQCDALANYRTSAPSLGEADVVRTLPRCALSSAAGRYRVQAAAAASSDVGQAGPVNRDDEGVMCDQLWCAGRPSHTQVKFTTRKAYGTHLRRRHKVLNTATRKAILDAAFPLVRPDDPLVCRWPMVGDFGRVSWCKHECTSNAEMTHHMEACHECVSEGGRGTGGGGGGARLTLSLLPNQTVLN